MAERGMMQVYTGDGKGKTTAAIGLAVRALGAGKRVFIAQFVKGMRYSELNLLERLEGLELRRYGRDCFIVKKPEQADIDLARQGLSEATAILKEGRYDLVILDEACIALYYHLFSLDELLAAIKGRAPRVEVVVTGRYAPQGLIDAADLVTEMREVKHYYQKGVQAREGIEK
ncbi:MAG TPA: cob(I)yrinic acid a,c-diamide adenosyltransferase [bacterium]|nr:cob(I)yrinic acid a,c-diamide adenosyltransferase [bacterium]